MGYIVVALWPICMLSMEYFRQKALSLFGAIYVVPLFEGICITLTSIIGMVYFEEYVGWKALNVGLYIFGILVVIAGVLVLSLDVGKIWNELYGDMVKTAFIDPDEIDYKFPKTTVFGGGVSEFFARKELQNRTFCRQRSRRDLFAEAGDDKNTATETQMADHIAGASGASSSTAAEPVSNPTDE